MIGLSIWDYIFLPLYLLIIYFFARRHQKKKIKQFPEYKYYTQGLFAKLFGGIGVVLIYCFYYVGGDTLGYWEGTTSLINLMFNDFDTYLSIMSSNLSPENFNAFDTYTGWPPYYMYKDPQAFSVIRFSSITTILGFNNFMLMTILVAWITYPGVWKLFRLFYEQFPEIKKQIAISILFVPSVCFWGSGMLKDAYTLSAAAWLVYSFYMIFIKKRKIIINTIVIAICIYVLISLKPYIFYAVFVGIIIMLTHHYLKSLQGGFIKVVILPVIVIFLWAGGLYLITQMGQVAGGAYSSVDAMLETAVVTQQDLRRDYYGENTFDIGTFDANIPSMLKKAPEAVIAGLYRPFLWECNNPIMLISGVENFILILLSFYIIVLIVVAFFKIGFKYMFSSLFDNSLVVFSFVFSIPFTFFIGLTTANFGALVRYKIPLIPFLLASLFIVIYKYNRDQTKSKT
ncbi:MAG TPA: hypothetical protein DDX39_02040 [Bacteroidales bacterium]|nr:MAG: hypothetical protein A2W98_08660 [Bacteroidetes bacterium GWF2_33_38]OFY75869.1 MAG: hypothetical protein A2265_00120 [Bacteroidetes bacterium RIFOXYA12_FULL_33_9]OFY92232.1 MAG: hypothetical protein A2236_04925 [Bacteroidetes bacterium RIFOXYA2_FULL_33_7]HBF87394.1 hypothetical protein [Bacteroidales bacterium]